MQIPAAHGELWADDLEEFNTAETAEDTVRAAGERLVAEVASAYPEPAISALCAAVHLRFKEADDLKVGLLRKHSVELSLMCKCILFARYHPSGSLGICKPRV